jgi:hypothetical protein
MAYDRDRSGTGTGTTPKEPFYTFFYSDDIFFFYSSRDASHAEI